MKKTSVLSLVMLILMSGCGTNTPESISSKNEPISESESVSDSSVSISESESFSSSEPEEDIQDELSKIEGVSSISKVVIEEENQKKNYFTDSYLLSFTTPIDWHNKELGYFEQRVFLGYKGKDKVNTYYVTGYCMGDAWTANYCQTTKGNELSYHYQGNFIAMEYRFYYQSKPESFDCMGTQYLDYLNSEQACCDFDNIVTKLQSVLRGTSIFTGGSKGGYTTETMAYYFPDDIDCYVSYVAPLCDGIYDSRFYDFVFNDIGDDGMGEEAASSQRESLYSLSEFALEQEKRDTYLDWLEEDTSKPNITLSGRYTLDEMWESAVAEMCVATWQYNSDFSKVSTILSMSEETEEEVALKEKAAYDYIIKDMDFISAMNMQDTTTYPYYFQAYSEMGNYCYCFDYLEEHGCDINTSKEDQKDLFIREVLTEEQEEYLSYSPTMRNTLMDFFDTTSKDIIKIVGYNDPWYSVSAPETDNSHIHLFKEKNCHRSVILGLETTEQEECWSIIDGLVK